MHQHPTTRQAGEGTESDRLLGVGHLDAHIPWSQYRNEFAARSGAENNPLPDNFARFNVSGISIHCRKERTKVPSRKKRDSPRLTRRGHRDRHFGTGRR